MRNLALTITLALAFAATFFVAGGSAAREARHHVAACGAHCIYVCGPHDCATTTSPAAVAIPFAYSSFISAASPVGPRPFYAIGFDVPPTSGPGAGASYYVPDAALIRIKGGKHTLATWVRLSPRAASALHEAAAQVDPYPAPTKLTQVIVDHSLANDPSSYLRLYTLGKVVRSASSGGWLPISLASDVASPWTDGLAQLAVSKRGGYVQRDGQVAVIPTSVARRARAGKSLR